MGGLGRIWGCSLGMQRWNQEIQGANELNTVKDVKNNKKGSYRRGFFRYTDQKRQRRVYLLC